jgi:hypothetical protein
MVSFSAGNISIESFEGKQKGRKQNQKERVMLLITQSFSLEYITTHNDTNQY